MKRSSRLTRHTPMPRPSKPMKARNPKRHAANQARAYGPAERREWIASLPCSVPMCPRGPSENAHTRTGGLSRKADADTIIPLCPAHHRELHAMGSQTFGRLHGVDLTRTAQRIANAWRARHPMTLVGDVLRDGAA